MSDYPANDLVVTERAAQAAWMLCEGATLTTRQIAEKVGLHIKSAYYMMNKIARVLPVMLDDEGRWHRIDKPLTKRVVQVNQPH